MKLTKDYHYDPRTATYNFRYDAEIDGRRYTVSQNLTATAMDRGAAPPLHYVWAEMRHKLLREIERNLFGDLA